MFSLGFHQPEIALTDIKPSGLFLFHLEHFCSTLSPCTSIMSQLTLMKGKRLMSFKTVFDPIFMD